MKELHACPRGAMRSTIRSLCSLPYQSRKSCGRMLAAKDNGGISFGNRISSYHS